MAAFRTCLRPSAFLARRCPAPSSPPVFSGVALPISPFGGVRRSVSVTSRLWAEKGSDEDAVGGWYSESSILGRISRKRKRGPDGLGRTTPSPSEEDAWLQAGAPGFTEDRTVRERPDAAKWATTTTSSPTSLVPSRVPWSAASFVRASSATVDPQALDEFVDTYERVVLPMYRECEGFLDAVLLVDRTTGSGAVEAMTVWKNEAALQSATLSTRYARAMESLAPFFAARPTTRHLSAELWDARDR